MNTKNNKRQQETISSINAAFVSLLQDKALKDIKVSDICELTGINRSTFYEKYVDIDALANAYAAEIEKQVAEQPHTEDEFDWIFEYIKANADMFKMYYKLGTIVKQI